MENKFAVIENGIVTNIVIAEDVQTAKEVTGQFCVEYTDANPAHIGLGYSDGVFEQPEITYIAPEPHPE